MNLLKSLLFVSALILSTSALARHHSGGGDNGGGNNNGGGGNSNSIPECMDNNGNQLGINNDQVLQWETSTQNQFTARAYVSGTVDQVFADETGHAHFSLRIGPDSEDHVEIIYNLSFGNMPNVQEGDSASACGDYITANSSGRDPSPDGALIHWVHRSTDLNSHASGFVILNGQLYGEGNGTGD